MHMIKCLLTLIIVELLCCPVPFFMKKFLSGLFLRSTCISDLISFGMREIISLLVCICRYFVGCVCCYLCRGRSISVLPQLLLVSAVWVSSELCVSRLNYRIQILCKVGVNEELQAVQNLKFSL